MEFEFEGGMQHPRAGGAFQVMRVIVLLMRTLNLMPCAHLLSVKKSHS